MMIGNRAGWTAKSCRMGLLSLLLCVLSPLYLLTSCSTIDEDMSDCGNEYRIDYELRLMTDVKTELQTQLDAQTDAKVSEALLTYLQGIFTDRAHDVNLSFYDTQGDMMLLRQDQKIMDANQLIYTITLPMREYMNLAVANLENNAQVELQGDKNCNTSHLATTVSATPDTINSHTTGVFTARSDMKVLEGVDQIFNVNLYMVNSAVALVLDPRDCDISHIEVYSTGFATGFNVNDSTYTFAEKDPIVRTQQIDTGTEQLCFCSVNFPSRDTAEGDEPLWQFRVYVTKSDGTVTETILNIPDPLRAGEFKIVQGWVDKDGSVRTESNEIATSVTFDWKSGLEIEY